MSVKYVEAVWCLPNMKPNDKFVLVCLADHADAEGRCYPSIQRIMERTGISERGVQTVIKRLCQSGLLSIEKGGGRGRSNRYRVHPKPRTNCGDSGNGNPAAETPFIEETPQILQETPQIVSKNPAASAGEPSRTVIEPDDDDNARDDPTFRERMIEAIWPGNASLQKATALSSIADRAIIQNWRENLGLTDDELVSLVAEIAGNSRGPVRSLKYIAAAMPHKAGELIAARENKVVPLLPKGSNDERKFAGDRDRGNISRGHDRSRRGFAGLSEATGELSGVSLAESIATGQLSTRSGYASSAGDHGAG